MKLIASVITAIGKLDHYNEFLSRYYENIQKQTIFDQLEVIIVYMEWHSIFDEMSKNKNFKQWVADYPPNQSDKH